MRGFHELLKIIDVVGIQTDNGCLPDDLSHVLGFGGEDRNGKGLHDTP